MQGGFFSGSRMLDAPIGSKSSVPAAAAAWRAIGPSRGLFWLLVPIFSHYFHVKRSILSVSHIRHIGHFNSIVDADFSRFYLLPSKWSSHSWQVANLGLLTSCRAVPCRGVEDTLEPSIISPNLLAHSRNTLTTITLPLKVSSLMIAMTQGETFPRSLSSHQD